MKNLDAALKKIKKKKEMKEAVISGTLAAIGKGAMVAAKAGAKAAKVGAKAGAKGAKSVKTVTPKVMGGEVKKSAQIAKNVKPKSGPTIDVKATEVGGEVAKSKKATMASKSSTPKVKYGKSKGGEIQKSQSSDITNKGKSEVDPKKNPESKPKEEPKEEPKNDNKNKKKNGIDAKEKIRDTVKAVKDAYGKSSFSVKEQKTFRDFLEEVSPLIQE